MPERNGWICLHRKFLDWEWYTDVSVAHLFLYCILRANYADTEWRGIKIKKGAFLTSYENLAKSTGLTIQQCRTALKKLKSTGEVTHKTTRRYSIITVNNWNLYQQINIQHDKLSTNYQQTNNKQVTTDNNNNNNNNINNNNNSFLGGKTDPYINKTNSIFIDEYQKVFNSKPYLMANQRNKLAELSAEVENFTDTIPTVLEKLKKKKQRQKSNGKHIAKKGKGMTRMLEMTRMDFIIKIFKFYNISDDNNELKRTYDMALSVQYPVDWNALYVHIIKTSEKKVLPLPKYFVDKLSQYKKRTQTEIADEGCTIRVTLDNGYYYDFTVVSFDTQTTVENIKKRFTYKDSAGTTKTKIKKIVYYPKGITFIGDTIFYEKDEEELKKQIKTLFVAP